MSVIDDMEIKDRLVYEKLTNEIGPFDFDGQNCNDYGDNDCSGWDGQDRRCNCGNRRVVWELSDCKTFVYGVAW